MDSRETTLYRHQIDAVQFAVQNNGQCALFHDPGLGKTRTSLEVFSRYKTRHPSLRLLVVCPLSLVGAAWGKDIEKFTNFSWSPFKTLKRALPDIVVINYEALISKKNLSNIEAMIFKNKFMCALDESSRLKNHKSVTTKTLLRLAPAFPYRIISSGTPMPNSELELWGQISFIRPDVLPASFFSFRNNYFHLERNGQRMPSGKYMNRLEMQNMLSRGWSYTITQENRKKLMNTIQPFTNWVKKDEALDLPEKIDEMREVILSSQEHKAYREMKRHLITELEGKEVTAPAALAKLMKLRQATSGFLYDTSGQALLAGKSSKLKELSCVLEELGKQPVIIWVQFHHEVEMVLEMIQTKFGQAATLYSKTEDRDNVITAFQNKQVQYLIAHPKSAAHGLTFVHCSAMIFFSLDYSYESHAQARDRIHRIGQHKTCLYLYFIAKDSIDEQLLNVINRKQKLQDVVYALIRK